MSALRMASLQPQYVGEEEPTLSTPETEEGGFGAKEDNEEYVADGHDDLSGESKANAIDITLNAGANIVRESVGSKDVDETDEDGRILK